MRDPRTVNRERVPRGEERLEPPQRRIPLFLGRWKSIRTPMKGIGMGLALACLGLLSSCDQGDREVVVSETRDLVLWDKAYPSNLKDSAPVAWRRVPWTEMRIHNYRFGKDSSGEVWVTMLSVNGTESLVPNINRWYKQFGKPELSDLSDLPQKEMVGGIGYIVEAEGTYDPGMAGKTRPEAKMLGVLVPFRNVLITVKMIGSAADVEGQREAFLKYCESLDFVDEAGFEEEDES